MFKKSLIILLFLSICSFSQSKEFIVKDLFTKSDKAGWASVGALYGSIIPVFGTIAGGYIGYKCAPKDGYYIIQSCDSLRNYFKIKCNSNNVYMSGDTISVNVNDLIPLTIEEKKQVFDRN